MREVLYAYFMEQNILPVSELVSKCKPLLLNQNLKTKIYITATLGL